MFSSYGNQSVDIRCNQLGGFYMIETLAFKEFIIYQEY